MRRTKTPRALLIVLGVLVVALLAVGAGAASFAITRGTRSTPATPTPTTPPPPPPVALAAGATQAPPTTGTPGSSKAVPLPAKLQAALRTVLSAPELGGRIRARIVDVTSGQVLLDDAGTTPTAPASTAKLLAAAALLAVHRPTDRIRTVVRAGKSGAIVLVGGGDPTLTGAAPGKRGYYGGAARISDLAAQVRATHVKVTSIVVDDGLFSGPSVSPNWAADDIPSNYANPITAVMSDAGWTRPNPTADSDRSTQPDLVAGAELASALGRPGLAVTRGRAPSGARLLGSVSSAPFGTLIAQMLGYSDNVIAECLARQVALATHRPASFAGAVDAVRAVLRPLGVDAGTGMVDASGLAARDRLTPATLDAVLRLAARTDRLRAVVTGLAVAAWSGTLVDRYGTTSSRPAAGVVRAKTGTLTGVSALAGLVHDHSGALLAFSIIADRTGSTPDAEAALDTAVARLAECGCR